jgi:outer membrane protein TolC
LKATEATVPGLEISLRQANNRLCTLLGTPTTDLMEDIGTASIPTAPPELALGIPTDLLRRRPDVGEAERNLAAQSAQIGIAEAELYPQFVLNGDISIQAERFTKLWRGNSFGYSAGPSFTWNILNYGRLINNVRFQEAAFQELVATYQNTVLEANQEVEDALVAFLQIQEKVLLLTENVQALQKSLDLAIIQFTEGAIDFTAIFVLQGALTSAQDQLGVAQGNVILSLINVYKALGGGWEAFAPLEETEAALSERMEGSLPAPATTQPAPSTQPEPETEDRTGS